MAFLALRELCWLSTGAYFFMKSLKTISLVIYSRIYLGFATKLTSGDFCNVPFWNLGHSLDLLPGRLPSF